MAKASVTGGVTDKRAEPGQAGYMPPPDEPAVAAGEPGHAAAPETDPEAGAGPEAEAEADRAPAPKAAKAAPSLTAPKKTPDAVTGSGGVVLPKPGAGNGD